MQLSWYLQLHPISLELPNEEVRGVFEFHPVNIDLYVGPFV